jgi:hypothetical protein
VTDTIRSYELNFLPVLHGVYPASVTHWGSQFVTGARAMSLQLAAASYIYIRVHYALKKRAAVVAKATVHKQGSVQRFKFVGRLEFSVGQWVI